MKDRKSDFTMQCDCCKQDNLRATAWHIPETHEHYISYIRTIQDTWPEYSDGITKFPLFCLFLGNEIVGFGQIHSKSGYGKGIHYVSYLITKHYLQNQGLEIDLLEAMIGFSSQNSDFINLFIVVPDQKQANIIIESVGASHAEFDLQATSFRDKIDILNQTDSTEWASLLLPSKLH